MAAPQHRQDGEGRHEVWTFYAQPTLNAGQRRAADAAHTECSGMTTWSSKVRGGDYGGASGRSGKLKNGEVTRPTSPASGIWRSDYAMPNEQGYDVMKYCGLYHRTPTPTAIDVGSRIWIRSCGKFVDKVTKSALSGNAGERRMRPSNQRSVRGFTPGVNGTEGVEVFRS